MEPEVSLPHLQVWNTCPYPEPDQSISCPPSPHSLPEDPSSYYTPIYAWVFQVVSILQVSPPLCIRLSSPPYLLRAPLTEGAKASVYRKSCKYNTRCPQQFHSTPSLFIPLYSCWLPDGKKKNRNTNMTFHWA